VLSPQGDKIAFVAHSGETKLLWVRSLSDDASQQLDGTTGAANPFWSPDGRYIGFFAGNKMMKISATGGPAAAIADAPNSRGGTWSANDEIVYAPDFQGALSKVSGQGGAATPVTVLDKAKHTTHRWPWFMPDGKHFIFLATSHSGGNPKLNGIYFGSVDDTESRFILATESAAQYASGHLLYRSGGALVAQPFDPERGILSGSATPLVNNLRDDVGVWRSIFAVSQNGRLIYQVGGADSSRTRLVWFDRTGKVLADYDPQETTINDPRALVGVRDVRLSPDNKRVAFANGIGIWTLDLERKTKTRITFDQQVVSEPAWSPDGKTLVFSAELSNGGNANEIRSKAADGSGAEKTVVPGPHFYQVPTWTPDGKFIAYLWGDGGRMISLWMAPVDGSSKPVLVLAPPSPQSNINGYHLSPDGHWLAYESDESGQMEIYLTTFPEAKGKWRVSTNGGAYPAWSGNGKELFYKNLADDLFVCPVTPHGSEIEVGTSEHLFHAASPGIGVSFDVSSDGKRLLVNRAEEEGQTPLHLVTNWLAELKK
jgi:Tol biopolymer transport system component